MGQPGEHELPAQNPTAQTARFDLARRGYDRDQVERCVAELDAEVRYLATDRDAAMSQASELATRLDTARSEISELRSTIHRLTVAADAAATTGVAAEARAAAEQGWAEAQRVAEQLRDHYQRLAAEADTGCRELAALHRSMIERAQLESEQLSRQAEEQRRQLDAESEQRRRQLDQDFALMMARRRSATMEAIAAQEQAIRAELDRRVAEATAEANRRIAGATERLDTLRGLQQRMATLVGSTNTLLERAIPTLEDDVPPAPDQPGPDGGESVPGSGREP